MLVRPVFAILTLALLLCGSLSLVSAEDKAPTTTTDEEGFVSLFNGKDLTGWKNNELPESFAVEDGAIVAKGARSHLFYVGNDKPFKNFELRLKVMTTPGSNAGVYFHTKYQDAGWPKMGFEAQVNTSHGDPIKTGSIYQVKNVNEAPSKDNEWFDYTIRVEGNRVTTAVNDKTLVDYTEPEGTVAGKDFSRKLDEGTFCLQAHDPKSVVYFKDIRVKRLD